MRRALGKGLSQLLGDDNDSPSSTEVSVNSISPNPNQPRKSFDPEAIQQLADSMKSHGILQPLIVRQLENGRFELIAGERRLRAAKLAGLTEVPILIRSAGELQSLELAIVENVQREDISPLDAARAYRKLSDEFRLTQDQIAAKVGKSRVAIANTLRLLKLSPKILEGLESGLISEGHARALLQIEDEALQLAIFQKIVANGLSVRDVEKAAQLASAIKKSKPKKPKTNGTSAVPNEWRYLQDGMSTYFSSPVKFEPAQVGGRIVIEFYSDDDLSRILDILGIHA